MSDSLVGGRTSKWVYALASFSYLAIYLGGLIAYGAPPGLALRNAFAIVVPAALLGLAIPRLPARLHALEERRAAFLAAHLGFLLAFLAASAAGWMTLVALDQLLATGTLGVHLNPRILPWQIMIDALIYCLLAGLSYAWFNAAASREQAARAARAETLRAKAELEAMRSQLNPHFIFNTYHALVGLVRRRPAVAEEGLERLGDLLRYSLRIQREKLDEVALRDEWSFVRGYLELERLRLGDRLRLSLQAANPALDCLVPSFAVQTLVENAIRHAIAPRAAGGQLALSAREVDGRLRIEVQDDGPGAAGARPAEADGHGLGLKLLQQRLAALYDGQASLVLYPTAAGGTCAVLELAARHVGEAP
jgi:signal transduction histidine kinase